MNKEQIKEILLNTCGNPETGVIADCADEIAEAIANECCGKKEAKSFTPVEEVRVVEVKETR